MNLAAMYPASMSVEQIDMAITVARHDGDEALYHRRVNETVAEHEASVRTAEQMVEWRRTELARSEANLEEVRGRRTAIITRLQDEHTHWADRVEYLQNMRKRAGAGEKVDAAKAKLQRLQAEVARLQAMLGE